MNLEPDALRREIDDTLAELERLEGEVIELFREVLGPEAAARVAAYKRAKAREPNLETLRAAPHSDLARPQALSPETD